VRCATKKFALKETARKKELDILAFTGPRKVLLDGVRNEVRSAMCNKTSISHGGNYLLVGRKGKLSRSRYQWNKIHDEKMKRKEVKKKN